MSDSPDLIISRSPALGGICRCGTAPSFPTPPAMAAAIASVAAALPAGVPKTGDVPLDGPPITGSMRRSCGAPTALPTAATPAATPVGKPTVDAAVPASAGPKIFKRIFGTIGSGFRGCWSMDMTLVCESELIISFGSALESPPLFRSCELSVHAELELAGLALPLLFSAPLPLPLPLPL
eukprot:CAMPEP_0182602806 /NCGR_PEP_ID=MMETSP1324-20130603/92177_1 /TAXON_ID=236786 /ORGANISM="Florenciella sp., Strain RCC1587" /LENGTH=179 /DNA_ID=CAMNT_0024820731 /DNA_START=585 /DNA_END=1120 /DNA_ORIENTATION=-